MKRDFDVLQKKFYMWLLCIKEVYEKIFVNLYGAPLKYVWSMIRECDSFFYSFCTIRKKLIVYIWKREN